MLSVKISLNIMSLNKNISKLYTIFAMQLVFCAHSMNTSRLQATSIYET